MQSVIGPDERKKQTGEGHDRLGELEKIHLVPKTSSGRYKQVFTFEGRIYGLRSKPVTTPAGDAAVDFVLESVDEKPNTKPSRTILAKGMMIIPHSTIPELSHLGEGIRTAEVFMDIKARGIDKRSPHPLKGRGIGTVFLQEYEKTAKEMGIDVLYAIVDEENKACRASLDKAGYERKPGAYAVDEWVDLLYYKRIQK